MKNGNGNGKAPNGVTPKVRCAIYTRKSTDEGLDQEFNSLDAQREAAEAYIASQKSEGWVVLPDHYDDGGYSGGTMERPALKRLLEDIEDRRVDTVVTYKVDRLSRSLLDFTKIVETFERQGVTFVSVTQAFNTTTSMGRLTLNILLSFAQFEREIIGERIRDKIAASKRKGKYCGGMPVLGYDVDRTAKKLIVNEKEARLVRHIFKRFAQVGSATLLAKELNKQGHRTKEWITAKGQKHAGVAWNKTHLYNMFNNRLYVGEVSHHDKHYPGEHEAIVPRDLFDKVQAILAENCRCRANKTRAQTPALLKGLIKCGHCGGSMGPTFAKKNGKTYRYYLCIAASKNGYDTCPVKTIAAGEIEGAVIDQLRGIFRAPEMVAATYRAATEQHRAEIERLEAERGELKKQMESIADPAARLDAQNRLAEIDHLLRGLRKHVIEESQVADALRQLDPLWDELFPAEQARIVQLLIERVVLNEDGIQVRFRPDGMNALAAELEEKECIND
jgi:site-specific DNA recombinase